MGDDRPVAAVPAGADEGDPFGGLPAGVLVGKYEIVTTLGQGGFGITYRARDTQLGRDVALKEYLPTSFAVRRSGVNVLPRSTRTAEDFIWGRERFLVEAKTLALLEEAPGIVNVYDFLQANGTAYMVMALVRGETLEARLKRERRMPQTAIEQMLHPLLDGLEKVHDAGFLHRDIKPANILLNPEGRPTLIDFGASRAALSGRTQVMTAVYTPGYAAFEQMTSGKQGPWTDIYALAATLYGCVAGFQPAAALDRIAEDRLVPAAEIGKGRYAPSLLAAIDAGINLKAADRPQSIAAWRRVLAGIDAESVGAPTREMDEPPTRRVEGTAAVRRFPALGWIGVGIVALAVAGGGAWLALRPPAETPEQALRRIEEDVRRQTERAAKLRQEQDAAAQARLRAEEEAARKAAEDRATAEAAARRQAEETERQRLAAEAQRRSEEEAARKAAEDRATAEAAARRQAEEAERQRLAAEAQRNREEEAARKAAEDRAAAEAAARRQAEEAERQRLAAEAQRRREEEAARKAAEDRAAAEAAALRKAEEEATTRRRAEEEAQRRADEARAAAEARRKADEEAEADARRHAQEETRARLETEAAARRREEELRREAEERIRAESVAREREAADARRKADEDARREAEERARANADAKRQAEAAEAALRLSPEDRKRVQVALTALGHNTQGSDGAFGPRTRAMITSWQKSQRLPETGYLTATQIAMLRQQAAPAIARHDEEQKKADAEKRKVEEDTRLAEEARRKAAEERTRDAKPPQQAAVAPPVPVPAGSAVYVGELTSKEGAHWKLTVRQDGSRLQFVLHAKNPELDFSMNCQPAELRPDGRFFTSCRQMGFSARTLDGTLQSARLTGEGRAGGGVFTLVRQ